MPSIDLSHVKPVRLNDLIDRRDAAGLLRILERGWSPPPAIAAEGYDKTLMQQVILDGWDEGWVLFRKALPDLATDFVLWTLALQFGRAAIVADFLAQGMDPARLGPTGLNALQVATAALGNNWSMPWSHAPGEGAPPAADEAVAEMAFTLRASGMDLVDPHPGEFAPGDLSPIGHTLWTRAVAQRRWTLAGRVFPGDWLEVVSHPRAAEAAQYLRARAILEPSGAAAALWQRWLGEFASPWLEAGAPPLDRPGDAPFILALAPSARSAVWHSLARADDVGWTGLHHLSLHGGHPDVLALLARMVSDDAPCLEAWDALDSGGVSPAEIWALALEEAGYPRCHEMPSPAEVLEAVGLSSPPRPAP